MDIRCSICGKTGESIKFKMGYVCEECLKYIKYTDPPSQSEYTNSSNEMVNGSENVKIHSTGIRHISVVDQDQ